MSRLPFTAAQQPRILVVEDDRDILEIISAYLKHYGYEVDTASDGQLGLIKAISTGPNLVVLDWLLPGLDGLDFLAQLRQERPTPVIMLTSKRQEADRITGLDLGADDYMVKPFSPRELVSRINAVLRRNAQTEVEEQGTLELGALLIDPLSRDVTVDSESLSLTAREFDLLWLFARHPGRVFERGELLRRLWPEPIEASDRLVDVHVYNLRTKLGVNPEAAAMIQTLRKVGYRFVSKPREG